MLPHGHALGLHMVGSGPLPWAVVFRVGLLTTDSSDPRPGSVTVEWTQPLSQVSVQLCSEQHRPRADMPESALPVVLPPTLVTLFAPTGCPEGRVMCWIQGDWHGPVGFRSLMGIIKCCRGGAQPSAFFFYVPIGGTGFCFLPCSPGWPHSHYVADGDLEFLSLLPPPGSNAGMTGVHH